MRSAVSLVLLAAALTSCGALVSFDGYDTSLSGGGTHYGVLGTVSGLGGQTVDLVLNGASAITVGDGPFAFGQVLADGDGYAVTVQAAPPGHDCSVMNGSGRIVSADASGVVVACPTPPGAPGSINATTDQDPTAGTYRASVTVGRAADESRILSYELYTADAQSRKLAKIASQNTNGKDWVVPVDLVVGDGGALPPFLLAISTSAAGEIDANITTAIIDNFPVYVDITATAGSFSGVQPIALIDTANAKLLVVTQDSTTSPRPSLFRCELDGTSCSYNDISGGDFGVTIGLTPSAAIDATNKKLLVVTDDATNGGAPNGHRSTLFQSDLDGKNAISTDVSAGRPPQSGKSPSIAVDAANQKLLIATQDGSNSNQVALSRCNLDGESCAYADISAGQPSSSGYAPKLLIDTLNEKLLVVAQDSLSKLHLYRCALDGTACGATSVPVGAFGASTFTAAIDTQNHKVLVVASDGNSGEDGLVRCELDGTGCIFTALTTGLGLGSGSGDNPSIAIDLQNQKLVIVSQDVSNENHALLLRCNLDGTSCFAFDVSAFKGAASGVTPSAVIDVAHGRLLIATNYSTQSRPGLFMLGLW